MLFVFTTDPFRRGCGSIPRFCTRPCSWSCKSSTPPPPRVKSSFYKRPSKAIEKGGGFYFPGLRGPRLRVFVGLVVLGLLGANGLSALSMLPETGQSLWISEVFGLTAAIAVLSSAGVELWEENQSNMEAPVLEEKGSIGNMAVGQGRTLVQDIGNRMASETEEEMRWAADVVMDLTRASAVVVCRRSDIVFGIGEFTGDTGVGEVVERVAKENRALYIADTATLPDEVRLPFLGPEKVHSVFLQPILGGDAVFVVAAVCDRGSAEPTFDARDRGWIAQFARKIEMTLRATENVIV